MRVLLLILTLTTSLFTHGQKLYHFYSVKEFEKLAWSSPRHEIMSLDLYSHPDSIPDISYTLNIYFKEKNYYISQYELDSISDKVILKSLKIDNKKHIKKISSFFRKVIKYKKLNCRTSPIRNVPIDLAISPEPAGIYWRFRLRSLKKKMTKYREKLALSRTDCLSKSQNRKERKDMIKLLAVLKEYITIPEEWEKELFN